MGDCGLPRPRRATLFERTGFPGWWVLMSEHKSVSQRGGVATHRLLLGGRKVFKKTAAFPFLLGNLNVAETPVWEESV